MTPDDRATLRRSSAHVLVDDVVAPLLAEDDRHHLARVLRLGDGAVVTVTDGRGSWRSCRFEQGELVPVSDPRADARSGPVIVVGVAIPKHDRPEWIVQKLTELGVDRIVFLETDRSVVRWGSDRAERHRSKLERVAREAVRQSRRVHAPTVEGPVPSSSFLPGAVAADPAGVADDGSFPVVAVGPEGGWTDRELALARGTVSLGPTVLRVETAALAAAVVRRRPQA